MSTLICSITSGCEPQQGQRERSSGNFSTANAPVGTQVLLFAIDPASNSNISSIEFDVMQDKHLRDPKIYASVKSGMKVPYQACAEFYIANPKNAAGQNFTVNVYASDS